MGEGLLGVLSQARAPAVVVAGGPRGHGSRERTAGPYPRARPALNAQVMCNATTANHAYSLAGNSRIVVAADF